MQLYDFIKDAISVAQKADNIDLYKMLLDIGQKALDIQNENSQLHEKIKELENINKIEEEMILHEEPYYTLKSDGEDHRFYCSTCWGKEHKKIQMYYNGEGHVNCPLCNAGFPLVPRNRKQQISY